MFIIQIQCKMKSINNQISFIPEQTNLKGISHSIYFPKGIETPIPQKLEK